MATFSPTTQASSTAATNTVPSPSSSPPALSYHHLHSTSNPSRHQNSDRSPLSDERLLQENETHVHQSFDTHGSYENNTDYSLCVSSNQSGNSFDVAASTPSASSHYNQDPIVRHFFHYRQNESNFTGNYYSNISAGSFVNAFDYSYSNIAPAPSNHHPSDVSVAHHSFPPAFPSHHHHPFVHSYLPYQQPAQPILKQADSFAIPVQQAQQQQQQPGNQHQNIYPWMRRIHNHTGELSSAHRIGHGASRSPFVYHSNIDV